MYVVEQGHSLLQSAVLKRRLLLLFVLLWVVSCLRPPFPHELILQHIPTVMALIALRLADRRHPLTAGNYAAVLAFLCLHLLGARYLYSHVPYNDWSWQLLGVNPRMTLGWRRNHYDRFVHFGYGLLMLGVARQFLREELALARGWSYAFALMAIVASGAANEMIEWLIALCLSPQWTESYNGQQGDVWDAEQDMALALAGAIFAMLISLSREKRIGCAQQPLSLG